MPAALFFSSLGKRLCLSGFCHIEAGAFSCFFILSRKSGENIDKDEGMTEAENRGRRIGVMAFSAIFIFIVLFNLFNGQPNYAPMAMFWAFLSAEAYPKYRFTKQKAYLVTTIAGGVASLASLASFVLSVLG